MTKSQSKSPNAVTRALLTGEPVEPISAPKPVPTVAPTDRKPITQVSGNEMNLCVCGHIEHGHVVVRPDVDPPAPYRGFCILDPDCSCQRYAPASAGAHRTTPVPNAAKRMSDIEKMLADAAAAVKRPAKK